MVRDWNGDCLGGFANRLGVFTPKEAELCVLRLGLSFAWAKGMIKLIAEVDSLLVFQWLMLHERRPRDITTCSPYVENLLAESGELSCCM